MRAALTAAVYPDDPPPRTMTSYTGTSSYVSLIPIKAGRAGTSPAQAIDRYGATDALRAEFD